MEEVGISSLPFELLRSIVWDEELERGDLEALRLSCRRLSEAAADRLFYRIRISKLNTDRDAFLSVCRRPHLAKHVREVEWLEILCDGDLPQRIEAQFARDFCALITEEEHRVCCRFEAVLSEFWLLNSPIPDRTVTLAAAQHARDLRRGSISAQTSEFESALDTLPNLHTFISRPMSSDRDINPNSEYPILVSHLQSHHVEQDHFHDDLEPETNDGLILFLLPSMLRLCSRIRHLRWQDEFPGRSYLRRFPYSALQGLESLELCWAPHKQNAWSSFRATLFSALSQAAPTLKHFKFCSDHGPYGLAQLQMEVSVLVLLGAIPTSPGWALRSLSLNLPDQPQYKKAVLVAAIRANAGTLRYLTLENMGIQASVMQRLINLPGLKLERFRILDGDGTEEVSEHALVQLVNGEGPNQDYYQKNHPDESREKAQIRSLLNNKHRVWRTTATYYEHDVDEECCSDAGSGHDPDCAQYRRGRNPPYWRSGYFTRDGHVQIWCVQEPDPDKANHATSVWKFTCRDGEVGYGTDPLDFFDDWDLEAGDREEPTPYGKSLRHYAQIFSKWAEKGRAGQEPPAGAFIYEEEEDPTLTAS